MLEKYVRLVKGTFEDGRIQEGVTGKISVRVVQY